MNVITDIQRRTGPDPRAGRAGADADAMPTCRTTCARWRGNACWTTSAARSPARRRSWPTSCWPRWQEQGGAPVATVIGHAARLPVLSAALVNGAASHALDFDDVNLAMPGHPSVAHPAGAAGAGRGARQSAARTC